MMTARITTQYSVKSINQKFPMNQKFIPIRAYDNYLNANMDMGMLQAAGINCHLKDEYTITIDPLLSPALGGMKLMVEEAYLQEALSMLEGRDNQD